MVKPSFFMSHPIYKEESLFVGLSGRYAFLYRKFRCNQIFQEYFSQQEKGQELLFFQKI